MAMESLHPDPLFPPQRRKKELGHWWWQEHRILMEESSDAFARYDEECRCLYANIPFAVFFGAPVDALLSQRPVEAPGGIIGQDFQAQLCEVMASGQERVWEASQIGADGLRHHLSMRLSPERSPDDRVVSVLILGRDISEYKQLQLHATAWSEVYERMSGGDSLHGLLQQILRILSHSTGALQGSVWPMDFTGGFRAPVRVSEFSQELLAACQEVFRGDGDFGPVLVHDLHADEDSGPAGLRQELMASEFRSCWLLPLFNRNRQKLGVFGFFRHLPGRLNSQELQAMEQACHLASLVIEHSRMEHSLEHVSRIDFLTGLPNRLALQEQVAALVRENIPHALLGIDLDHFREVNESYDHRTGDCVLTEVAGRIKRCVVDGEMVARVGADEFCVLLTERSDKAQAMALAERLSRDLSVIYASCDDPVWLTASIGIVRYPEHNSGMTSLLRLLDRALATAKENGRNRVVCYDQTIQERLEHRLRLSFDLRFALAKKQMAVYFQPIMDLTTGQVCKAEALLRWTHPEFGPVSPAEFIPIAEENGLIRELGDWVFKESVRVALAWNRSSHSRLASHSPSDACQINVNWSPQQIFTDQGIEQWISHLQEIGLHPGALGVEITEGLLLEDRPEVLRQMAQLKKAGVSISLDDFGTGYSSLSYLKKFDIDFLKIDRSFVRDMHTDPESQAITEAIIVMAHRLGMKLVAEGVENAEQGRLLASARCDFVQGYYFAKPMPEDEFLKFVTQPEVFLPPLDSVSHAS